MMSDGRVDAGLRELDQGVGHGVDVGVRQPEVRRVSRSTTQR